MFFFLYLVFTPIVLICVRSITGNHLAPIVMDLGFGLFATYVFLLLIHNGSIKNLKANKFLCVLLVLFFMVIFLKIAFQGVSLNVYSLIELKIPYYLMLIVIIATQKEYNINKIEPYFLFFSILYTVYVAGLYITNGYLSKEGIFSESNYDGFLILMGYTFLITKNGLHKKEKIFKMILYSIATFLTFSTTCLVSLVCINILYLIRIKRVGIALFILIVLYLLYPLWPNKIKNIENADRMMFWNVGINTIREGSLGDFLTGFPLGRELPTNDARMGYYVNRQSLPKGIYGLFPFNFHSFHLRFFMDYGILTSFFFYLILYKQIKDESWGLGLIILILVQGFSMSVFYISVLSVPLLLVIFAKKKTATINPSGGSVQYLSHFRLGSGRLPLE